MYIVKEILQLRTDILYHYIKQLKNGECEPSFVFFLKKMHEKGLTDSEVLTIMENEYDKRLTYAMPRILHDIMAVG